MKKLIIILNILAVSAILFVACEDRPDNYVFPVDEYVYEIPDVPVTEDYVIGVPYDTRYRDTTNHVWWDSEKKARLLYTGTPVLGEYDIKEDVDVLRQHLDWGKEAGIDFFILPWGGHGYNDTILTRWKELYAQDNARPKVMIRFEVSYCFKGKDTLQLKPLAMDSLRFDLDSVYTHVMQHDFAYKKKDGKPAMVFAGFTNAGQIPRVNDFVSFLKSSPAINNNIWLMADLGSSWTSPEKWGFNQTNGYSAGPKDGYVMADSIKPFDAFFISSIVHNSYDRYYSQYSYLDYNYRYWQERMAPIGKEWIPGIMPAFDNRVADPTNDNFLIPRWKDGAGAYVISDPAGEEYNFSNYTENPYKKWANVAKRNVGSSRMIIVYNWNDYGLGRNLEPTIESGTDYLRYTREFFKKQ